MADEWGPLVAQVASGALDPDAAAQRLIERMTDGELLGLLDGDAPRRMLALIPFVLHRRPFASGAVPRLGVPGFRFSDGPRGTVLAPATAFPVAIARAATWDPELEQRVGRAIGLETRARGADYSASVCVNLLRHPAWGRAQESYGEDPVLAGRMGAAATAGVRANAMVCVKHFACNSIEDARFQLDVQVGPHDLHEVYLPAFKAVVDAGADSVMSAYNSVNGAHVDVNDVLLTDVLRDEWGFTGFVTTDWVFGLHDAVGSLEAGTDVEMPLRLVRARDLPSALASGRLRRETVLRSARRILRTRLAAAARFDRQAPAPSVVASAEHRALAREAAAASIVLLQNEPVDGAPVLPLAAPRRVAVLGRLAATADLGDFGSSRVRPPATCPPLQGLREALPDADVRFDRGRDPARAAALAARADVAVVVVGLDHDDEGESVVTGGVDVGVLGRAVRRGPLRALLVGLAHLAALFVRGGDRVRLGLRPADVRLVRAVTAANPRTVVVLIGGSAILCESWRRRVPALLQAWYPGMEGGRALADVLTGAVEPGGRLPFAVPADAAHLPDFDRRARRIVYDRWFGQRLLDRDGRRPSFPFGSGLGYTTFEVELLHHLADEAAGSATVRVRNTGDRAGSTVAQLYAADTWPARLVPRLVGFRRVRLAAGEETVVQVDLDLAPTRSRDPQTRAWGPRAGRWVLLAAQASPRTAEGALPLH